MKLTIKKPIYNAKIFGDALLTLKQDFIDAFSDEYGKDRAIKLAKQNDLCHILTRTDNFLGDIKLSACDITYENNTIVLNTYVYGLVSLSVRHIFSNSAYRKYQWLVRQYILSMRKAGLNIGTDNGNTYNNNKNFSTFFELLEKYPNAKFQIKLWKCMNNGDLTDFIDITDQMVKISDDSNITARIIIDFKLKDEAAKLLKQFKLWLKNKEKTIDDPKRGSKKSNPRNEYYF